MELDASLYSEGDDAWFDNTGNGNNALINGPRFTEEDTSFFRFDGRGDTMTIAHTGSFSLLTTQQRTMQMWVKLASVPSVPNRMVLFGKMSSNFNFDGWWGGVSSTPSVAGNPLVIATKETTSYSNLTSPVQLNTWYLFTYITQITGTSDTTKVYLNSTSHISTQHPAGPPEPNDVAEVESNDLTIGCLTPPLTGLGQIAYLRGDVGAVYFYTRGLSQAEISTNFEATRGRFGV
jgi:hypothetical protein